MPKQKNVITEFRSYQLPVEFPILILTGDQWRISDIRSKHLHFHNCLEIGLCHEGSGILQIQKDELPFSAGDITCIARNIPHTTFSSPGTSSKWSYIFIDIQEFLDPFAATYTNQLYEILKGLAAAKIISAKDSSSACFYFMQIINGITEKRSNYQLKTRADALSLAYELSLYMSEIQISTEPTGEPTTLAILPALEYIKLNYMNSFPMEYLADLCGLSPTHFRRIFNLAMGRSPLEYLNSVRITKACYLLRSTENSILSISEDVGFHSISSFNRYFDRMVGIPPREYRHVDINDDRLQRTKIMKYNGWTEPEY